jgi:ACS family hexuronate transporter-like MFS transporter
MQPLPGLRFKIVALLAIAIALNYLDRQNFPLVVSEVGKEIPISNQQYSQLQSLFLFAYAISYAAGGRIIDWLGARLGYTLMIVIWSWANGMHGLATSVGSLAVFRVLLGLGEGAAYPGAAKAVSEWFPPKERSWAFGVFNSGSSIGSVIAPPLIALIVSLSNWRWVFFATGLAGLVCAWAWWKLYDHPARHRFITTAERRYLADSIIEEKEEARLPYWSLFRYRQIWGLIIAKFLSDGAWYLFIFWLPRYLSSARGLDIQQIGYYGWIPYALAGCGSISGGWFSSFLIRHNVSVDHSRKLTLAIGSFLLPVCLFIVSAPLHLAIVFFAAAFFGHQVWSAILQTLTADLFPSSMVGSVAGLLGAAGSLGGVVLNLLAGFALTAHYSYSLIFAVLGMLHPASFLIVLATVGRIGPLVQTTRRDKPAAAI